MQDRAKIDRFRDINHFRCWRTKFAAYVARKITTNMRVVLCPTMYTMFWLMFLLVRPTAIQNPLCITFGSVNKSPASNGPHEKRKRLHYLKDAMQGDGQLSFI